MAAADTSRPQPAALIQPGAGQIAGLQVCDRPARPSFNQFRRTVRSIQRGVPVASLLTLLLLAGTLPAGQAAPWKDCSFNDRSIPCRDSHFADGSVRIVWQDGLAMTYRLIKAGFPISILRDALGGSWEREILPQGNAVFVNPTNGNRIVVPLR
jgi:hypothetical protein